jgi:hypothetical protein
MFGLSLIISIVLAVVLLAATIAMFVIGRKRGWLTQLTISAAAALDLVIAFGFILFLK